MSNSLLKLQLGPVQEFIAQARNTRDLWSASYLLSWLISTAITEVRKNGGTIIFPSVEDQPLIKYREKNTLESDQKALLTPNLPNLFVARINTEDAKTVAQNAVKAIKDEWKAITDSVWDHHSELKIRSDKEQSFKNQVDRFLSIAWQITPETAESNDYAKVYQKNSWELDAVRQTRDFRAYSPDSSNQGYEKDSLTGKEEAIAGGKDYGKDMTARFQHLFKHADNLGAITLVKRVWHLTYLKRKGLKTDSSDFPIPSTSGIALHKPDSDGDSERSDALQGEKYFAVLTLDGDQIGKWISGSFTDLENHHKNFSTGLSEFALKKARKIIEDAKGRLIYAGGDDVLALLPADKALTCAQALRKSFMETMQHIQNTDVKNEVKTPDCSVGVAVAHFKAPLQDIVRAAQMAEKRAKNQLCRSAVSVTLIKHSGETIEWGCQWGSGGLEFYRLLAQAREGEKPIISAKFPYRFAELLTPYLTATTGLMKSDISGVAPVPSFPTRQVIEVEFEHVLSRQVETSDKIKAQNFREEASKALAGYLDTLESARDKKDNPLSDDAKIKAVIGLCQTVAFTQRIS